MAFTHTITQTYTDQDGTVMTAQASATNDAELNVRETIATSATNLPLLVAFPFASITSCVLYSDVALTLKTNSSSSPTQTISLAAGVPQLFQGSVGTNPFTANVTEIFVTNPSSTLPAHLSIDILLNA